MAKKNKFVVSEEIPTADFELVFHSHGSVELFDDQGRSVWQSDADDDFADEFEGDFFSMDEDGEEILDYLHENGYVDLDEHDIDMTENDLTDDAARGDGAAHGDSPLDNVLEGSFREIRSKRK